MSSAFTHITDPSAAAFVAGAAVRCGLSMTWADPDAGSGCRRTLLATNLPLLAVRRVR